jgi:hypothetical protein
MGHDATGAEKEQQEETFSKPRNYDLPDLGALIWGGFFFC